MSTQLFENGDTITKDGVELVCIAVDHNINSKGEKVRFSYTFCRKNEEVEQPQADEAESEEQ